MKKHHITLTSTLELTFSFVKHIPEKNLHRFEEEREVIANLAEYSTTP